MQTQARHSSNLIGVASSRIHGVLDQDYDVLRYTVEMELREGQLRFGLKHGHSNSWKTFATANENLYVGQPPALQNLVAYHL